MRKYNNDIAQATFAQLMQDVRNELKLAKTTALVCTSPPKTLDMKRTPTSPECGTMFLSSIASPPTLVNRMMSRHELPYAEASKLVAEARTNLGLTEDQCTKELKQDCEHRCAHSPMRSPIRQKLQCSEKLLVWAPTETAEGEPKKDQPEIATEKNKAKADGAKTTATTSVPMMIGKYENMLLLQKSTSTHVTKSSSQPSKEPTTPSASESENRPVVDDVAASHPQLESKNNVGSSASCNSSATVAEEGDYPEGIAQQQQKQHEDPVVVSKEKGPHSPTGKDNDSASEVTTTTNLSGVPIPTVIYIRKKGVVPLNEPLEAPLGVRSSSSLTKRPSFIHKIRDITLRQSPHKRAISSSNSKTRLTELDDEVYQQTLLSI